MTMLVPPALGGLTALEASRRLSEFGRNALPPAKPESLARRFWRQLASPLIYILLLALAVDLVLWATQESPAVPFDAIVIAGILVFNAGLGVWQERKAERALAKLADLATPRAWVVRDQTLVLIPTEELVPGDLVRLEVGDRVPADGEIRTSHSLSADESVVTGESLPVDKAVGAEAFAGTLVVRGSGYLEITRTGSGSTMGRLATMLTGVAAEPTPLERRLDAFARRAARWVLLLALVMTAGGVALTGSQHFAEIFLFAVALAVAAVPEGLPAVMTVTLALGVERMARRKAVVRRLAAVEALGSVTIIATDKTGTLTENDLVVHELETDSKGRALAAIVLANDADSAGDAGDPLDVALIRFAIESGVDVENLRQLAHRISSRPFDAIWKFTRATVRHEGRTISYTKGAPEIILAQCDLSPKARADIGLEIAKRAEAGFRALGLAWGEGERESGLTWLGWIALWDPPRPEVAESILQARAAGVKVCIVTGDHPQTALTLARSVGIGPGRVVAGPELDRMSEPELRSIASDTSVFARVTPAHKLRIVEALQANGEIVAMTGDGVNDAPALKRADVGIAMGKRGSAVTREVADVVLLDDNFATIVAAIEEGRSVYANIQKFIRFLLSTNLSEVLVVTIGAIAALSLGLRDAAGQLLLPLTAAQLLWINLITDGAPALAIGLDRNPGVLSRRPRDPGSPLLDRASVHFVLVSAFAKAAVGLALLVLLPTLLDQSREATRSALFLFLAAGQLLFAYPARNTELRSPSNPMVHLAIALSFLLQVCVVSFAPLMAVFGTVPIRGDIVLWVATGVAVSWGFAQMASRVLWRPVTLKHPG